MLPGVGIPGGGPAPSVDHVTAFPKRGLVGDHTTSCRSVLQVSFPVLHTFLKRVVINFRIGFITNSALFLVKGNDTTFLILDS